MPPVPDESIDVGAVDTKLTTCSKSARYHALRRQRDRPSCDRDTLANHRDTMTFSRDLRWFGVGTTAAVYSFASDERSVEQRRGRDEQGLWSGVGGAGDVAGGVLERHRRAARRWWWWDRRDRRRRRRWRCGRRRWRRWGQHHADDHGPRGPERQRLCHLVPVRLAVVELGLGQRSARVRDPRPWRVVPVDRHPLRRQL